MLVDGTKTQKNIIEEIFIMLNESKGNMFEWVTHTFNPIKGRCSHDCDYCFMKAWGEQKPLRLDEKELKCDLGKDNFIFVGSSTDLFAADVPEEWIVKVLECCAKFKNSYVFQSKNPMRYFHFLGYFVELFLAQGKNIVLGTTIETNRHYKQMKNAPSPKRRSSALSHYTGPKMITIEPIMDFDHDILVDLIRNAGPKWVNIGADSKNHGLPEPSKEKLQKLIDELEQITEVKKKSNLRRLLK